MVEALQDNVPSAPPVETLAVVDQALRAASIQDPEANPDPGANVIEEASQHVDIVIEPDSATCIRRDSATRIQNTTGRTLDLTGDLQTALEQNWRPMQSLSQTETTYMCNHAGHPYCLNNKLRIEPNGELCLSMLGSLVPVVVTLFLAMKFPKCLITSRMTRI